MQRAFLLVTFSLERSALTHSQCSGRAAMPKEGAGAGCAARLRLLQHVHHYNFGEVRTVRLSQALKSAMKLFLLVQKE